MRKVIAYIAMSLDGYIAKNNQDVAWLAGDGSDSANLGSYPEFIESIDTIILGYTTYHQIITELSPTKWVYEGKQSYVLTSKELENEEEITFTNNNLEQLIAKLKASEGENIWVCGGASVINQFHKLNLIDEYTISIIPTILGSGIRLFENFDKAKELKLISIKNYNGIVDLTYEVRK